MNKREIYKKGIEDASNSYHRKFRQLSENMSDSIQKQDEINERNYRLQNKMIDNEERMDKDIDKLYEMLGEEREPGTSGNATYTPHAEKTIIGYTDGVLNKYNSFSNLDQIQFDAQIVDAIAGFLTTAVERDMNKKFHQKLSILEKNGIISEEKFEYHKSSVIRAKQLTGLGVYATFSLAPIICSSVENYLRKTDVADFVVGSYAYINRELSPMIEHNIMQLLSEIDIKINEEGIQRIFGKYCDDTGLSYLPIFSRKNRNLFGNDGVDILAKEIVSRCDLHEVEIKNRALEFVEDFLKIDSLNAEKVVSEAKCSQDAISDITWFSSINYRYVFLDFVKDVANAQQFAFYDIGNDPYRQIREERRQQMENLIHNVSSKKSLFLTNSKRKDIIEASAKMLQYSLNPDYDIAMDIKMIKREKEILKLYGI